MIACRLGVFSAVLYVAEGRTVSVPVTHSPYILADGSIQIFPGETLVFRLPLDGDKIGTPEFVAEYAPAMPAIHDPQTPERDLPKLKGEMPADILAPFPPGTLILSYGQFEGQTGMYLIMLHNLPKIVKLDAFMAVPTRSGFETQPTTTCPLKPDVFGIENWPHPIGAIVLKNLRILPENANLACD
jgi:hypothetical protein